MNLDISFNILIEKSNDFYSYVNSNWQKENPTPDDFGRWGSFTILSEDTKIKVKEILEKQYEKKSIYERLNVLYNQGNDFEKRQNIQEIYFYINEIKSCSSISELLNLIVNYSLTWNIRSPFKLSCYNDFDDANTNILHIFTGGLGLPDKDYYLLEDNENIRIEYKKFLKNFNDYFNLELDLDGIYNLEKQLAQYTYSKTDARKPELLKNSRNIEQLLGDYPSFSFITYFFDKLNINPGKINISNPNFFFNLNKLFFEISLSLWKDYFIYKFLISSHSYLSVEVEEIVFNFYGKILSGTPEIKPLWKRSIDTVESQLGQLIGKKYVEEFFPQTSKIEATNMINYLKNELRNSILQLDWMEPETKEKALNKLDVMQVKVGYPDVWRSHNSDIGYHNSYLKNNFLCNKEDNEYRFNKLYKDIDRTEWFMDPHEVNAYYSPSFNEIVFPAGILQPPFFSDKYDKALNFGAIGTVIGHEMTHGFDDQGSKFDSKGNLNNWWSKNDELKFKLKTTVIKNQFNNYTIEEDKVNGELTLGENIADLGGLFISLEAFKKYLKENPEENKLIENLTPIQRFFISYTRIWRCNTRKEEIKKRLMTDPHSPPSLRVNGIIKNIDDFYEVFDIKKGDGLFLEKSERAKIW